MSEPGPSGRPASAAGLGGLMGGTTAAVKSGAIMTLEEATVWVQKTFRGFLFRRGACGASSNLFRTRPWDGMLV